MNILEALVRTKNYIQAWVAINLVTKADVAHADGVGDEISPDNITSKVFLYNQPNLSDEMDSVYDRVYTYSVWKLTQ